MFDISSVNVWLRSRDDHGGHIIFPEDGIFDVEQGGVYEIHVKKTYQLLISLILPP